MKMRNLLVLGLALVIPGLSALADDFNPPNIALPLNGTSTWDRGSPLSASAGWEFLTNANPAGPDDPTVPTFLPPSTSATLQVNVGLTWEKPYGHNGGVGRDGWYNDTQEVRDIVISMPNWVDEEPYKLLRLQMTYDGPGEASTPTVTISGTDSSGKCEVHYIGQIDELQPNHMHYDIQAWKLVPNPDSELITISLSPGYFLEEVVIDTISTPEPASLSLLALGGLALIRRRRK